MKNREAIRDVKKVLLNVSMSNVSTAVYTKFELAALNVIDELKEEDRHRKRADDNANS